MTVAELDRVTKRFGAVTALDGIALSLEPGSTVALLGPNGAGKSTLVSLLTGLRRPDDGRVRIGGLDPRDWRARRAVGALPQEVAFPQTLRVRELVAFVAAHFPERRALDDLLEAFGLAQLGDRQTGGLSIGQRRRLALALAFSGRPRLVVLDEPTAALDAEARAAVWRAVRAAGEDGAAVLVATHDLDEAEAVASRVVALDRGRVAVDGSVAAVRARAGLTRIRFRSDRPPPLFEHARCAHGRVILDVRDAGSALTALVRAGVALPELEVRPLTLEEALAAVTAAGS